MSVSQVEILYLRGCPNMLQTVTLVQDVVSDLRVDVDLHFVEIMDAEDASERRFLGSPTVRVDGTDVEPGADRRGTYVFASRVYRSGQGQLGWPEGKWIRAALERRTAS